MIQEQIFDLGEGLTPIDVWQGLHSSAEVWIASAGVEGSAESRRQIDENDSQLLKALGVFPAERWSSLCEGVGWSSYGAIALSWCKEASLEVVLEAWSAAFKDSQPQETALRPARMIKAELLNFDSLSQLFAFTEKYDPAWLLLAACKGQGKALQQDLGSAKFACMNSNLRALL